MTFYFPDTPPLFKQAFDASCDRILQAENDATFYALLVQFVGCLRESLLLKQYILPLEAESAEKKRMFHIAALEAVEDLWQRYWTYHPRLKQRRQLVLIKRMVSAPKPVFSCSHLYQGILFDLLAFRQFSPLCRPLENAPRLVWFARSEQQLALARFEHMYPLGTNYFAARGVVLYKQNEEDTRWSLHKCISRLDIGGDSPSFKWSVELLPDALFSPKVSAVDEKFLICGRNEYEKRKNMQMMAETDFTFCWGRLCFIERCYLTENALPERRFFKGRWQLVREAAWESANKQCESQVLLGAKMALRQKIFSRSRSDESIDSFLRCEDRVHRKDCEKYLLSLKNHVHVLLFKVESAWQKAQENPLLVLPGTRKKDFVIDLARQFWKADPGGNRDAAYEFYCLKCPLERRLQRDRWNQIVREEKLDHRPPEARKRGPGKKTCKK